jgi:betaine-aldehyde dehydrogenase
MQRKMLIGADWVDAQSGETIDCLNPATEEVFATVPAGGREDVARATSAARKAFEGGWARSAGKQRGAMLRGIAKGIRARKDELAKYETMDAGKPAAESDFAMEAAAQIYELYAEYAEELDAHREDEVEQPNKDLRATVEHRPVGVAGLITPWNFPIGQVTWKVAAALAAGCTCVVKPSEFTSITALELGEIALDAGLPPGVLNIVTGTGPDAGEALVLDPNVNKISFTGSTRVGRRIMELAARDLKRVGLELGGKSSLIVFDDVDVDQAVEWSGFGVFFNQGQVCSATSRLLLHEGCADAFLDRMKTFAEGIVVGDGSKKGVQMGPLVNQAQYDKVTGYIEEGKQQGATLLTGGGRPKGLNTGYFVEPTIFTDVRPDMSIWNEEIFGPVLSVMTFREEEEALRLANDTPYGLAGAVLSGNKAQAERIADGLDAGVVWLNCNQLVVIQAPWGGIKQSGMGRELGRWGLEEFFETKQKTRWLDEKASLGWYST